MEQKKLSGITDDRGKFIHITEQEFDSVAKYVLAKGRVNRQELLNEANKIIRMEPTAADQKAIQEESRSLLSKLQEKLTEQD